MEKVCVNHPESPSVGSCKACEKPVCLMCIVEVQGVSFCSEACGSAYQEVKDWLERPAADEEWNPLADSKPKTEAAPAAEAAPAPVEAPEPAAPESAPVPVAAAAAPAPEARRVDPSGTAMRAALSAALADDPAKPAEQTSAAAERSNASLYIAIAATVLIIVGAVALFNSSSPETPAVPPPIAKSDPVKPEPPKPQPPKPEPPKPEPVKPEPPKPEPVKPTPKPEPAKPEPPKPEPVKPPPPPPPKPEPPKPEPVKPPPPPPPKPEPVKPEPPKPEVVKPEPPKPPPPKPELPPAPHLAFLRDPWGKEKPGAWYRFKTTANGQESYRDVGLRELGAGYRVLVSQVNAGGKTEPEQFTWTEPEEASVFGSVNGDAQGTKYSADVVRTKSSRPSQYVLKDGPHAGAVFPSDAVLTRLDLQSLKVKGRDFSCSVMETDLKDPKRTVRTWFSAALPLGAVKTESDGATTALVDLGEDWTKRPAFPEAPLIAKVDPPKPPPPPPPKPEPVKPEPPKPEPVKPTPPRPEPIKPEPPKPEPVKPEPPKPPPPPPPKPEPPKPEPVKPEPPKPPPPPPPKPEPPKPEPPKPPPPPPPKPEPPKPEPVKPEPPKPPPPPPPKPEPPKPEPVKPEPPKPEPPKPEPRKEDASTRVRKSMADAAALIREATPLYQEVAGAMESMPDDKAALRDLVGKAERVTLKLGDARILYTSVKSDAPDPVVLDRRLAQLDELLASVQQCVKKLKARLE